MRRLSGVDAQFLALEDGRNHAHVSAVGIYDPSTTATGELTLEDVRRTVAGRLDALPPFRWRLVEVPLGLGHPVWAEDDAFDLGFHLREIALPAPGSMEQLCEQVARIHGRPLDRAHPLWELYVISGLSGGRVAVMTKVHHAAVDGVSGAELLAVLLDPAPEGRPAGTLPAPRVAAGAAPGAPELVARALLDVPGQALRAARYAPRTLVNADQIATLRGIPGLGRLVGLAAPRPRRRDGGVLERPPHAAPRTRLNGRIGAHRRFAATSLSLDDVKRVKDAAGVTVNDVVVALCAGALRRRLLETGELPVEPLLAMVPVSVRTPDEAGTFGNRISTMVVALPTGEPHASERLALVHDALRSAKERHEAIPATLLQDASHLTPPAVLARASRVVTRLAASEALAPPVNVTLSNVPGPRTALHLAGALLEAQFPVSAITDGMALNITVMSYRDRLDVGVVGDRELVPDVRELGQALHAELADLSGRATGDELVLTQRQEPS